MKSNFELFKKRSLELLSMSGINPMNVSGCWYELILEAGLDGRVDRVSFPVIHWAGQAQFITEIRLHQTDTFICNEWGLFLLNAHGEMDVSFEEHTFPDENYFTDVNVDELNIFYNADLSLIINNLVVFPGVRTDVFKNYMPVVCRRDSTDSGLKEVPDGYMILVGSKNIYFNLDMPRKTNWKDASLRLRLRLRGLLFRNSTILT